MTSLNRSFLSFLLFLTLFQLIYISSVASGIKEEVREASTVSAQVPYETLPVEIVAEITQYLDTQDLIRLRGISRTSVAAVEIEFQRRSPVDYSLNLVKCLNSTITIKHPQPYTVSRFLRNSLWSILTGSGTINQPLIHQLADFSEKWNYVGQDLFEALKVSPDIESFLKSYSCQSCLTRTEDNPDLREIQLLLHVGCCVFNIRSDLVPEERLGNSLLLFAQSLPSSEQKSMASLYLYDLLKLNSPLLHNYEAMKLLIKFCADQELREAQYHLGIIYNRERNIPEGMNWYQKAAAQDHAAAQFEIGMMYAEGRGVDQDEAKALMWYQKAAVQNHAAAQFMMGVMYEDGYGVDQDYSKALVWYQKAAVQNHAAAQFMVHAAAQFEIGMMYAEGRGVDQDEAKALMWYQKAAVQNHAAAQFEIGMMYTEGRGVAQDYSEALVWYQKAAVQNHAAAQFMMGVMYAQGWGVAQDYVEAMRWYKKAAAQNYVMSQYYIGLMYEHELGVAQDYVEAMKYYKLAADQGHEKAKSKLEVLSKKEGS